MTRPDLRSERGMTMIAVMVVMLVGTMLAGATLIAAEGDLPFAKASADRKQAYAAAESGLEFYRYQLTQDTDYWQKCDQVKNSPTDTPPVNQRWRSGADPRVWQALSGTGARFTVELLPAVGDTCTVGSAPAQMLDPDTGTFRIRATGQAGDVTRSLVATFRRNGFLDYLYFTDFETLDPEAYANQRGSAGHQGSVPWARVQCGDRYRAERHDRCVDIRFTSDDENNGPFHTNDDILACGGYKLGARSTDRIEISGPARWQNPGGAGCNGGDPQLVGKLIHPAKPLFMPPTNAELRETALDGGTLLTGRTVIHLKGGVMDVSDQSHGNRTNVPLPANGVIYVDNGACSTEPQSPLVQDYNEAAGCANVSVHGTYSRSLTIASRKDIVVGPPVDPATGDPTSSTGDLVGSADAVLGLIADNYVRVSHPVRNRQYDPRNENWSCENRTAPDGRHLTDIEIDAAILSLNHSFIVDNYPCGAPLGTLTITGAIAQLYRGPVGSSGGGGSTGFVKNYNYDYRLKYRTPPFFINPVSAAWNVTRQNEQVPATR